VICVANFSLSIVDSIIQKARWKKKRENKNKKRKEK